MPTTISGTTGVNQVAPNSIDQGDLKWVPPLTKEYVSGQQTWSTGSLVTVTHGLGVIPKLRQLTAVCLIAEHGFSVGDEISLGTSDFVGPAQNTGFTMRVDTTSVNVKIGASGLQLIRDSDGLIVALTAANWRLIVRAWA